MDTRTAHLVGRFAPSPTGPLHFGSLTLALASYLSVKAKGGQWLVRMEDLDPPREQPGAKQLILEQLSAHGLKSDLPVTYQSERLEHYHSALDALRQRSLIYPCDCPRKRLPRHYPGFCRSRSESDPTLETYALRYRIQRDQITHADAHLGERTWKMGSSLGDFVVQRRDQLIAYQLAVVHDDIEQGVTEVVRGSDLINSTPYQLELYQALNHVPPMFWHFPVVLGNDGAKLSKQTAAQSVDVSTPADNLKRALRFLGQSSPDSKETNTILQSAVTAWQPALVPKLMGRSL